MGAAPVLGLLELLELLDCADDVPVLVNQPLEAPHGVIHVGRLGPLHGLLIQLL